MILTKSKIYEERFFEPKFVDKNYRERCVIVGELVEIPLSGPVWGKDKYNLEINSAKVLQYLHKGKYDIAQYYMSFGYDIIFDISYNHYIRDKKGRVYYKKIKEKKPRNRELYESFHSFLKRYYF